MAEIKRDWKIGDKFRVKSLDKVTKTLNEANHTSGSHWIFLVMNEFCNRTYEVKDIEDECVIAKINMQSWEFAHEWIEPVAKYPWSKYVSVE